MATLGFRLTVDGLDDETLVVREYQGHESISDSTDWAGRPCYGYRYQIELASRRMDLSAEQLVDTKALLEVLRDGEVVQKVHGIIRTFTKGDTGHHHTFYSVTLVPALERLSLRHNSRIFQQQTVPEILSILLQEMNISDYSFSLKNDYVQREFCVQYRETDLTFFHRLAAEEGILYTFVHENDKHILLITDDNDAFQSVATTVPYNVLSGGVAETPYVSQFTDSYEAEVSSTVLQDYSFKQPEYNFAQSAEGTDMDYQIQNKYEHFDYPGRFKADGTGKVINQVRLEYLRRNAHTAEGKSNEAGLQAGKRFTLSEHLDEAMNREWLLIEMSHQGTQPQALEEAGGEGQTSYANQFMVVPSDVKWQATPQPKPQVDGPTVALVVGPDSEEIYCDEHGRVKLHFPWDRYSNADENSSCWVRVSQGWAGAQYGMMAIPRIGHEVIVSFLNGDPDQPIVTGRTYHVNNKVPYTLPENKTKTVIRTETHQGEGFNEMSFEDQSGSEKIYMHAQKDFEGLIENDSTTHIKHDKHVTVENDQFTKIVDNDHLTVNGEARAKITKTQSLIVNGSLHIKTGKIWVNDTGTEVHIKAGQKVTIEAGSEITVSASGSFVKVDPSGVSLSGPMVNINSGGSAGSGSGVSVKAPKLPGALEDPEAPEEITVLDIQAVKVAEEYNYVAVKPCPYAEES